MYPCLSDSAPEKSYRGHSAHVANCRFTVNDDYLITIGCSDNSVFQWKTDCVEGIVLSFCLSYRYTFLSFLPVFLSFFLSDRYISFCLSYRCISFYLSYRYISFYLSYRYISFYLSYRYISFFLFLTKKARSSTPPSAPSYRPSPGLSPNNPWKMTPTMAS